MSSITKLFVLLLVVFSLLLTSATVVFVNQVADYKSELTKTSQSLAAQVAKNQAMQNEIDASHTSQASLLQQAAAQTEGAKQKISEIQQQLIAKDTQLAQVTSQQQLQSVENMTLAGGLKEALETTSRLQEHANELRTSNDKLVSQNSQLNMSVNDLTSRLDLTERERRLLAEQLTESKGQVDKQSGMLRDLGVTPAQYASAGTKLNAPPINGVIRDVGTISGVLYATISVGSADSVTPGMEFKVVNRQTGAFLGVLTVDTVEQNAAIGRLKGPKVSEIKSGAEVKTQL